MFSCFSVLFYHTQPSRTSPVVNCVPIRVTILLRIIIQASKGVKRLHLHQDIQLLHIRIHFLYGGNLNLTLRHKSIGIRVESRRVLKGTLCLVGAIRPVATSALGFAGMTKFSGLVVAFVTKTTGFGHFCEETCNFAVFEKIIFIFLENNYHQFFLNRVKIDLKNRGK